MCLSNEPVGIYIVEEKRYVFMPLIEYSSEEDGIFYIPVTGICVEARMNGNLLNKDSYRILWRESSEAEYLEKYNKWFKTLKQG